MADIGLNTMSEIAFWSLYTGRMSIIFYSSFYRGKLPAIDLIHGRPFTQQPFRQEISGLTQVFPIMLIKVLLHSGQTQGMCSSCTRWLSGKALRH